MSIKRRIFITPFLIVALLSSCNDTPQSYEVPHEPSETIVSLKALSNETNQITWQTPAHWTQVPASGGIRIANFEVKQEGEVTITSFPGQTGGLLQNINRWATQLGLPAVPLKDISSIVKTYKTQHFEYDLVHLQNTNTQKSMHVAIIRQNGQSWFIKLTGPTTIVTEEKPTFKTFVETLSFGL